jgi:hypothetical protein
MVAGVVTSSRINELDRSVLNDPNAVISGNE